MELNIPFVKINKEIEKNYCFYWYHYLNAQLEYMKYWQLKTKDLEILLISLQSIIQSNKISFSDISATSVSEVTGIPRATCIRKLEWLAKSKYLRKDPENKRYSFILDDKSNNGSMNHPMTNVKATIKGFCDLSSIMYRSLTR